MVANARLTASQNVENNRREVLVSKWDIYIKPLQGAERMEDPENGRNRVADMLWT